MIRRILRTLYMVGVASAGLWLLAAMAVFVGTQVYFRERSR